MAPSKNFTVSPLTSGGPGWEGPLEKCSNYASVSSLIRTDRACVLKHQFYSDGTNCDYEKTFSITASSGAGDGHVCETECVGKFFRVRVEPPSGGDQTYLRVTTTFKDIPQDSAAISDVTITSMPPLEIAPSQEVTVANDLNVTNSLTVGSLPDVTLATGQEVGIAGTVTVSDGVTTNNFRNIDVGTAGIQVKASSGNIFSIVAQNLSASDVYLKIYNVASPSSSDSPVFSFAVRALSTLHLDYTKPPKFSTAIGIRASGELADNDTTALGTNDLIVNMIYSA